MAQDEFIKHYGRGNSRYDIPYPGLESITYTSSTPWNNFVFSERRPWQERVIERGLDNAMAILNLVENVYTRLRRKQ